MILDQLARWTSLMEQQDPRQSCGSAHCGCGPQPLSIGRRGFLALSGLGAAGVLLSDWPAVAGPFEERDFESLVPRDKKLNPQWIDRLTRRGEPEVYRGGELNWIGMPVGGIACGQLYLGGDGRLWYWDIFTSTTTTDYESKIWAGPHYEHPLQPRPVVEQGFAIRVTQAEKTYLHVLDRRGFKDITFRGEYPIGRVTYHDDALPVDASLEAFSPFIPLNVQDSSLPATVLSFQVRNTSRSPVEVSLSGWLENAVCRTGDGGLNLRRQNSFDKSTHDRITLFSTIEQVADESPGRPDIVFADFKGTLTSPPFTINRRFIQFRIGGGSDPHKLGMRLLIDGKVVRRAAGHGAGPMRREAFDVRQFQGKQARLQIIDDATGGWGHTTVDQIVLSDRPVHDSPRDVPGYGSMALSLLGDRQGEPITISDVIGAPPAEVAELWRLFPNRSSRSPSSLKPMDQRLVGALGRKVALKPGESATFTFILSWWFPYYGQASGEMAAIREMEKLKRHYIRRFDSAAAVAAYVAEHFSRLSSQTRLWRQNWYDSSLPYWFLDRALIPVNCLATQAFHAFDNGRYWGWEGVDCCPGTCQHVWQYAQSVSRLFPAIERDLRERIDFGLAWHDSGAMDFRAENDRHVAHDGFCGTIIRAYREHQMAPDSEYLKRIWTRIKRSLEFIMSQDRDADGLLEGEQMNTLDTAWFGPMAWISSLYLAAAAAGAAMASEQGDAAFADRCRKLVEAGQKSLVAKLYNGEYFIHEPPDYKHNNTNIGCHSDQMLGQSMAFQVNLPRIVPEAEARSALHALWRYNFTPDVGPYREKFKTIPGGRWYAMPGEGGLLVTTFPRGGADKSTGTNSAFAYYFNECWTGFEYSVAAQMLWEGMITEGMAIVRMIHDRYHPARRNPYNEVECSDHYARAMASHGVFLAACGFEYHGPKSHLGFAPRLTPEAFRAPFTASAGWGTISQKREGKSQHQAVEVKWGKLSLKTLAFEVPQGGRVNQIRVSSDGQPAEATHVQEGQRVVVTLAREVELNEGQLLEVILTGDLG
jgi:non-lysosomal glucosylceramidase